MRREKKRRHHRRSVVGETVSRQTVQDHQFSDTGTIISLIVSWLWYAVDAQKEWIYSDGSTKGEALLPRIPCLQPQLLLWKNSLPVKTKRASPAWNPLLSYTLTLSPDLWCAVYIAQLLRQKSSSPSDKIPFIWGSPLREHYCSPRVRWFLLWALVHVLVTNVDVFPYLPLSVNWALGGWDRTFFLFRIWHIVGSQ